MWRFPSQRLVSIVVSSDASISAADEGRRWTTDGQTTDDDGRLETHCVACHVGFIFTFYILGNCERVTLNIQRELGMFGNVCS